MSKRHSSIEKMILATYALFVAVASSYACHSSSGTPGAADAGAGSMEDAPVGGTNTLPADGAGGAGGASSWGVPATGGTGAALASCKVNPSTCNDGVDNDGDGRIDAADPECVGPCDNDEGTFATGIAGDNMDACKQDCFFDGDSGAGNDGCDWDLRCDPASPGASAAKACPYDASFKNCPAAQSQHCIDFCRRLTPNGCDCFGCCMVPWNGTTRTIMLAAGCTADAFGDPSKCPPCTQNDSCLNPCGTCEICVGKPAPDPGCELPPPGTPIGTGDAGTGGTSGTEPPADQPCPDGVTYCGNGGACPDGRYCQTGCCVQWIL